MWAACACELIAGVVGLVPLPRTPEPFLEMDERSIAQDFAGQRNIGLRVADITRSRRLVSGLDLFPNNFAEDFQHFIQSDSGARSAVEHRPRCTLCLAGPERF